MTIAFMFPGQGSQAVGMGRAFYETSPGAKAVFQEAADALGFDLTRLVFEGPESELALTANTQPAVLTVDTALARLLGLSPDAIREKYASVPVDWYVPIGEEPVGSPSTKGLTLVGWKALILAAMVWAVHLLIAS